MPARASRRARPGGMTRACGPVRRRRELPPAGTSMHRVSLRACARAPWEHSETQAFFASLLVIVAASGCGGAEPGGAGPQTSRKVTARAANAVVVAAPCVPATPTCSTLPARHVQHERPDARLGKPRLRPVHLESKTGIQIRPVSGGRQKLLRVVATAGGVGSQRCKVRPGRATTPLFVLCGASRRGAAPTRPVLTVTDR
jgi:hypothetical protein